MNPSLASQMQRVEALLESLENLSNPAVRIVAQELVQAVLALHAEGLKRMLSIAETTRAEPTLAAWSQDALVASLLMLHGCHPVRLEARVREVLAQMGHRLRGHGSDLQLVAVGNGRVRLRLRGTCSLSPAELEHTLEEAFVERAPEIQVIEVEYADAPRQRVALPLVGA